MNLTFYAVCDILKNRGIPLFFRVKREKILKRRKNMKKIVTAVTALFAAVMLSVVMAACTSSFAGTYKFSSMEMNMSGVTTTITAGGEFMGVTISEDYFVLVADEDGTFSIASEYTDNEVGTWEQSGSQITLTADGESISATLSGKKLTLSMTEDGISMTVVLVKV